MDLLCGSSSRTPSSSNAPPPTALEHVCKTNGGPTKPRKEYDPEIVSLHHSGKTAWTPKANIDDHCNYSDIEVTAETRDRVDGILLSIFECSPCSGVNARP